MPTVKGGVWTNIEDEILKASVSKYGLNQWARVSSLLARKTPKQCKARWAEWLDPSIRKIEWSKDEDEKLLHLAKLMPTQWRTIAPIVGRTATQCLERYQKLLDDAEARESSEFGLGGPEGGETQAPSADDVRRLRPGELDPDPESKPARPDTIDLDEDEKEMLSEARARLANTQGKKAKRKARERQLEESRRLAVLQKRRELKTAGINIKVTTRKPGQMDYNADIPFEKPAAPGFYDTTEEDATNEKERQQFDPRKQQLANKRKNDEQDQDGDERKRKKTDKKESNSAFAAAQRAGQLQKIREAERSSKRKGLSLPAPQVSEAELEDIVKMGMSGQRAGQAAGAHDNDATRGLVGDYTNMPNATPLRTPRAPQGEDRIANEIRNARARTETQSALLGGENPDLEEGDGTTGYGGAAPSQQVSATPNPMATPLRQGMNGTVAHPSQAPGQTPLRTPRDNFRLNDQTPGVGQTPREVREARDSLRNKLAALPKPKETEWDLDLPEEQEEAAAKASSRPEDAALRDAREREARLAAERADFARQTQVVQRSLPRPSVVDVNAMLKAANHVTDSAERAVALEAAQLVAHDAKRFGASTGVKLHASKPQSSLQQVDPSALERARMEIALEVQASSSSKSSKPHDAAAFEAAWSTLHDSPGRIPGLSGYADDDVDEHQLLTEAFDNIQERLTTTATTGRDLEKKLSTHLRGYQVRAQTLRAKVVEAAEALEKTRIDLEVQRGAQEAERGAIAARLERAREELQTVLRRERFAQEEYAEAARKLDELHSGAAGKVNGVH